VFFALSDHALETSEPIGNVQIRHYLSPLTSAPMRQAVEHSGDMIAFFAPRLGAYPFAEFGVLTHTLSLNYALETQTLVAIPANWGGASATLTDTLEVVAHELAHQWFGMQVTLRDYRDIWLHEGFATYLGWLYTAQTSSGFSVEDQIRRAYPSGVNGRSSRSYTKSEFLAYLRTGYGSASLSGRDVEPALQLLFGASLPAVVREAILNAGKENLKITELVRLLEELSFTRVNIRSNYLVAFAALLGNPSRPLGNDRFIAPGRVSAGDLVFNRGVYLRGAAAVYALRFQIGEPAFWALLQEFLAKYKFGNASLEDFTALTKARVGADAAILLEQWLFDERVPDLPSLGLYAKDYVWGADFK
jgi:aminopeptidase N